MSSPLSDEVLRYINSSVLCWLATSDEHNMPNVSPKEVFAAYGDSIIIAHIASPQSIRNINQNPFACVSFVDILVQKGYQVKGRASVVNSSHKDYPNMEKVLTSMTGGIFPFSSIIRVHSEQIKPVIAPRYILYADTTEESQIRSARKAYGFE